MWARRERKTGVGGGRRRGLREEKKLANFSLDIK
jgi:hypothetical protein